MSTTVLSRPGMSFGRIVAASFAIGVVITLPLIGSKLDHFSAVAALARQPHWPDLQLFFSQSPAMQAHVLAALGAVGLGAVLMLRRKGKTFHRIGGWVWSVLLTTVALSSLFIFDLTGTWSYLHLFSGWVMVFLPLAVLFAKRRRVTRHRTTMMVLFYGSLLISGALAFLPGRLMWQLFFG
jgi:uncharacterized membrane protein